MIHIGKLSIICAKKGQITSNIENKCFKTHLFDSPVFKYSFISFNIYYMIVLLFGSFMYVFIFLVKLK